MRKDKREGPGLHNAGFLDSCRPAIEHPAISAYASRKCRSLASGTYYQDKKINNTRAYVGMQLASSNVRINNRNNYPMQNSQYLTGQII